MGNADLASVSVASSTEFTLESASLFTDFPFTDFPAVSQVISAALKAFPVASPTEFLVSAAIFPGFPAFSQVISGDFPAAWSFPSTVRVSDALPGFSLSLLSTSGHNLDMVLRTDHASLA